MAEPEVSTPATTAVHVLLPSHSHSFNITNLPLNPTVADLKRAISQQCVGRPQVSGQRIITQGRVLTDSEILPHAEPCVVHLAVHPAAWTTTPPSSPRSSASALPAVSSASISIPPTAAVPPSNEPPLPLTLQLSSLPTEFITYLHANALRILSGQAAMPWPGPNDVSHARRVARTVIKYAGLGWPPILEQDLTLDVEPGKRLQYTSVVVDGLPYLALTSPDMTPTPAQLKALQVLTYTFPLLPLMKHLPRPAPVPARQRSPQQALPQAGQVIRRFGINVRVGRAPAARAPAPDPDGRVIFDDEDPRAYFPPVPEFRFQFQFHLPPSRVLLQLLFTLSRAAVLLYFFAPARQPLWLTCIIGWIGWEIYVVLRHTGRDREPRGQGPAGDNQQQNAEAAVGRRAGVQGNAPVAGANAQGGNQAADGVADAPDAAGGPNPPATLARAPNTNEIIHFINRIAHMNLAAESKALNVAVRPLPIAASEPGTAMPPVVPPGAGPPGPPAEQRNEQPLENVALEAAVEPNLVHRSTTFLALFVTSLFPVIWERRRARLRERERWVRDMFIHGRPSIDAHAPRTVVDSGALAPQPSGPEVAQRRVEALAGWRRAYVERVISGEAGDDGEAF